MKELREEIMRCMRCGFCRAVCPVFEETMLESNVARGKLAILEGVIEGKIKVSKSVADRIFQCTTCRNCYVECPSGVQVDSIIQNARVGIHDRIEFPVHKAIAKNIISKNNPFGEEAPKIHIDTNEEANFVYFPGCMALYRTPEIATAAMKILSTLGQPFGLIHDFCCGSILIRIGRQREAEELIQKNVDALVKRGMKVILTSCSGCYRTLKYDYGNALKDKGIEVIHLTQFITKMIKKGRLRLTPLDAIVTYHDPCHLGRHANIYDEPREILNAFPKLKFVEMARSRENARCCGAGGGLRLGYPSLSQSIAKKRIGDAEQANAKILISACPFCYKNLSDAAASKIKIQDISALVAQHIGGG
jgi:Fe-S oxidoreductase